jgi:predicted membrane channel-forming protein YqfA (hemolysin III family)
MYEQANESINQGLSLGARIVLGAMAALFGGVMIMIAPSMPKPLAIYFFGAFCCAIAITCFTTGRVRQFVGSIIGSTIFLAGVAYLVHEVFLGHLWPTRSSEPSVLNAIFYLSFIGIPGAAYAYNARFGLTKKR